MMHCNVSRMFKYPRVWPALSVDGKWHSNDSLHQEAVHNSTKNVIIVEIRQQSFVEISFIRRKTINWSLHQVSGTQSVDAHIEP